ncbi:776_t:CDS:2, partial [Racocetra fulgida]
DLPPDHPNAKTHREVMCLSCPNGEKTWLRKIGDFNTSNLWRHVESHHPDKDLRRQDILEEFMNQSNSLPEFSQATFRKFLAQWVISDSQPFMTLENIHFRRLVKLCIAHIINIGVQDILKNLKAGEAQTENDILDNLNKSLNTGEIIPKLRKLIVNIRSSPQRRERFAPLDAITSLNKELKIFELNDNEWNKIKEIVMILKIFARTTKLVSSAKYPLLASTIPIYNYLINELEMHYNSSNNSSEVIIAMNAGLKKLKEYYERTNYSAIYSVAMVLDPRLKLNYYKEKNWDANFINGIKETVVNLYENNYMPIVHETDSDQE